MRDYYLKKKKYCPFGDELFIQMIKFSWEWLGKFTPWRVVLWLRHRLETWETLPSVSTLQQAKQDHPAVFCIPGASGDCCQAYFSAVFWVLFWGKSAALDFTLILKGVQVLFTLYGGKNPIQVLPLRTHIIQIFGVTSVQGAIKITEFWKEIRKFVVLFLSGEKKKALNSSM